MAVYHCASFCQYAIIIFVVGILFLLQQNIRSMEEYLLSHAAIFGGGLLSGSLHALTGPDHLAALLPSIFGKRWALSSAIGVVWGTGHGLTASVMGLICFLLRGRVISDDFFVSFAYFTDFAVGITLMIIGVMGLNESYTSLQEDTVEKLHVIALEDSSSKCEDRDDWTVKIDNDEKGKLEIDDVAHAETHGEKFVALRSTGVSLPVLVTIFLNGALLGLSWDGLPSLTPALGIHSIEVVLIFLVAYCLGTGLAMAFACALIGECTRWLGRATNEKLPVKLAFASSIVACAVGVFWIAETAIVLSLQSQQLAAETTGASLQLAAAAVGGGLVDANGIAADGAATATARATGAAVAVGTVVGRALAAGGARTGAHHAAHSAVHNLQLYQQACYFTLAVSPVLFVAVVVRVVLVDFGVLQQQQKAHRCLPGLSLLRPVSQLVGKREAHTV